MRVAMLGAFAPQSQGVIDYCSDLAVALGERVDTWAVGFKAMYPAALYPGVKSGFDPSRAPLSAPHLRVTHRLTYYNPLGWIAAGMARDVDVFHAQWWGLPLFPIYFTIAALMRARGKKVVVTVHNVLPHERSRGFVFATKALCKLAHVVIVHSEENRQQALEHLRLPANKIEKVAMGFQPQPAPKIGRAEARGKLGLRETDKVILLFGALRPYKGVEEMLRAMPLIACAIDGVKLIVAGQLWMDWTPFEQLIGELNLTDRVLTRLQYVPAEEAEQLYAAADIVALPYRHFAAQSAVGSQALGFGKPMIVSRTGGLPDWVENRAAWICEPHDAASLAERTIAFLADQKNREEEFAEMLARMIETRSWRKIAERHLEIYRR